MKASTSVRLALLAIPLAFALFLAPAASAQSFSVSLTCPFLGGTCEATPQLPAGFLYAFQSQGNAVITTPTPVTSPATVISCLRVLPTAGRLTVTVIAPDGSRGTASVSVCPGVPSDSGPFFPF